MKNYTVLFLVLLLFSCNNENEKDSNTLNSSAPKTVEAKGYVVPKDSMADPKIIPIDESKLKKVLAGKPKVIKTNLNVRLAGQPKIILAGSPMINKPGTNTFLLPKIIEAKGEVKSAGIPEVLVAKDAVVKDVNPANISFYKTRQGIKNNNVRCMLQDKKGNLWFGTEGGVSRYDGKTFTNFTLQEGLANNYVFSMLEDIKGNLWFATYGGGVSRYDGKDFTNFTDKNGLVNNYVWSMIEDKNGNLWFGTEAGVCKFDGKFFTCFSDKEGLVNNVVLSLVEDKKGNIWVGTEGGVSCYNGSFFANFTDKEGLANNYVFSIHEAKEGQVWFGTGGGVSCYDGEYFKNFTNKEGLISNYVFSITHDKEGVLWFGTQEGISSYDGKYFMTITDKDGLSDNYIFSILLDRTGCLWFGSYGGGVSHYNGSSFTSYTDKEGLTNDFVFGIHEDKNEKLWFASYGQGVFSYDGKSFANFTEKEGLSNNYVFSILEDKKGNLWFGTNGGVCRYDGKFFTRFTDKHGLSNNVVLSIVEDKNGDLWFGTNGGGVSRYNGKSFTNYAKKEGLASDYVFSALEDKNGNLWFGTNGGGVTRYDGKNFTNFSKNEGLINNIVLCILEDNLGNIWFGSEGGISRYDGKRFVNFTEKDGLVNNSVLNLLQDKAGNIWLGTRKGLSKITQANVIKLDSNISNRWNAKNDFNTIKDGLFYNYGYSDGFLGLNCHRNSVLQDSKGFIWWGADVLTCYNPKGDFVDTTEPVLQLNSVKLFGENVNWGKLGAVNLDGTDNELISGKIRDTILDNGVLLKDIYFNGITKWNVLPENLSLPYYNNNLSFSFIGTHIQDRNHIKYQFKLEGTDGDWSSVTERTEASYGNLLPGVYVFKVKGMNQSGRWSVPIEFKFEVRPPWWQTWWFRFLIVIIILGSVIFYIKWRERALKERQKTLETKVDEATQEIKEQKTIVEVQKHLIEERHKEITDSINYAERIQRSLLASKKLLDENLSDYFIFFKPKDVVSGDFYWAASTRSAAHSNFLLCVADSTGHGVPGAIMSILNISCLKEASLQGITSPELFLNETRRLVIENLKNDGSVEGGKDGMDGSLLSFDFKNNILNCATANNPVWIIRAVSLSGVENKHELIEVKSDRFPIGKHERDKEPFTLHTIQLQKGDVVYALTDGFPDQFGGSAGKKYKYRKLQELLLSISSELMSAQKQRLNDVFNEWKGDLEQVDDVTIVGVRV